MKKGAVIVDVAIDQGGCVETAHPTTHSDPVYEVDGVMHYCVANMPGAVPRTSTFALTNATLPVHAHAREQRLRQAVRENDGLAEGVNVYKGEITYEAVATSQGRKYNSLRNCFEWQLAVGSRQEPPSLQSPGQILPTARLPTANSS